VCSYDYLQTSRITGEHARLAAEYRVLMRAAASVAGGADDADADEGPAARGTAQEAAAAAAATKGAA
jgi:hypothetical protein